MKIICCFRSIFQKTSRLKMVNFNKLFLHRFLQKTQNYFSQRCLNSLRIKKKLKLNKRGGGKNLLLMFAQVNLGIQKCKKYLFCAYVQQRSPSGKKCIHRLKTTTFFLLFFYFLQNGLKQSSFNQKVNVNFPRKMVKVSS